MEYHASLEGGHLAPFIWPPRFSVTRNVATAPVVGSGSDLSAVGTVQCTQGRVDPFSFFLHEFLGLCHRYKDNIESLDVDEKISSHWT